MGAWKAVESRKGTTVDSRVALDDMQLARTLRAQLFAPMLKYAGFEKARVPEIDRELSGTRQPISPAAIAAGVVRVDEVREREGLPLLGGEEGARFIPAQSTQVGSPDGPQQPPE